ncbi:MAG: SIR2 family protein [Candidatus Delongbacteria bacterium]|nr:SIR2 family protein [Candidatus Delongbacteria bacterium]
MAEISTTNNENLIKICSYLYNDQMSAFIGSGFSKNADKRFPSWNQLLFNMVEELYREEIDTSLESIKLDKRYRWKCKKTKSEKILEKKKEIISRIINRQGVTNIPEEYIRYKGRREDLTEYIEENILSIDSSLSLRNLKLHQQLLQLRFVDVCTTNYDSALEKAAELLTTDLTQWKVVTSSDELLDSPRKRIIKLHGSLRRDNNRYNFDGIQDYQYIITRNDYENYPNKHYGFTTFMQAKVLQESLCMIGFSGDDPNFKSWIYWVRDLLKKNGSINKPLPIFFIDVSDPVDVRREKATELYFKNHNITRIILSDIYNWLYANNHPQNNKKDSQEWEIKKALTEFFEYLKRSQEDFNSSSSDEFIEFQRDKYFSFWDSQLKGKTDNADSILVPEDILPRLPHPYGIVRATNVLLPAIKSHWKDNHDIWALLEKSILFSKTYLLLPHYYFPDNGFNEVEQELQNLPLEDFINEEKKVLLWVDYLILVLKTYRLHNDFDQFSGWCTKIKQVLSISSLESQKIDSYMNEISYQTGLFYANRLEFEKLSNFLLSWKPEESESCVGQWLLKKCFLINLFQKNDKDASIQIKKLLEQAIEKETNPQEKLWLMENYSLVLHGRHEKRDNIQSEISLLNSKSYISLGSITDYFHEKKNDIELKPADSLRNKGKTISIGGIPKDKQNYWKALQYFYLIEESGLLLKHQSCYWDSALSNYHFFKELITENLFQGICHFLVYSGGSSEEESLRKFGQDIIFNEEISLQNKEKLLFRLIDNFEYGCAKEKRIREIFFLIAELMRIVDYSKWAPFWRYIWNDIKNTDFNHKQLSAIQFWTFRDNVWGWRVPLNQIIAIIDNKDDFKDLISSYLLDERFKELELYSIRSNPHFRIVLQELLKEPVQSADILRPENSKTESIFSFLTKQHKKSVVSLIDRNDLGKYSKNLLFNAMLFVQPDDAISEYLFNLCIEYIKSLPDNSFPGKFPVSQYFNALNRANFDKGTCLKAIFDSYVSKWESIQKYIDTHFDSEIDSWGNIPANNCLPYYEFFKANRDVLNDTKSNQFMEEIENTSKKFIDSNGNIENKIISSDIFDLEKLMSDIIDDQINYPSINNHKTILLMINRILFIDHVKNESLLFLLVRLFYRYKNDENVLLIYKESIQLLLEKYKEIASFHDRIYIEDHCIRIVDFFEPLIAGDSVYEYWKEKKENSPFFEVRNLTKLIFIQADE